MGLPVQCAEWSAVGCSDRETILGVPPIFGSLEAETFASLVVAGIIYVVSLTLSSKQTSG
jgi:hypothetical protein